MSRSRRARLRALFLLVVGATVAALAVVLTTTGAFRQLELDAVDARFAIRGPEPRPADLVVVGIDDVTFDELGERWPFRRSRHAGVLDQVRRAGARVVVYDVQFTEATGDSDAERLEDNALITAARRLGRRLVLATTEVNEAGEGAVFGTPEMVPWLGATAGNAVLPFDSDGVVRRMPRSVDGLQSLAVATVQAERGTTVPRERFDDDGTAWIDFVGPPGTIETVSFSRVLRGRVDPATFRDKIVVVGMTAPSLQDVKATSAAGDRPMSGPEIHANAIATLRDDRDLRATAPWPTAVLAAVFGLLAPLASLRLPRPRGLLLAAGLGVAYAVLAQAAFARGLVLPVVVPLGALVLGVVGVLAVEVVASAFERERVRELFTRFVPEGVVDEVIRATDDDLRLVGTRVQGTVVFCDLRRFTGFAELREPEEVLRVLNRYCSVMSEAIRERGGTLLAYTGDGILAVFGAPVEQPDHADRAVAAVRDMAGPRLERFNAWLRREGLGEDFRIGVGVNSGEILCGNVGCTWRLEYTAVGDTVNTASRLEALTKETPYQVLISDTTRAMLRTHLPDLRYVDAVTVRGKQIKANLWGLDAGPADPARAPTPDVATAPR